MATVLLVRVPEPRDYAGDPPASDDGRHTLALPQVQVSSFLRDSSLLVVRVRARKKIDLAFGLKLGGLAEDH